MKNIKAKVLRHQQYQGPAEYVCTHSVQGMEKPVLPQSLMLLQGLWSSLEAAGQCSSLEQLCCAKETKSEMSAAPESTTQPTAPHYVSFSPLELKPLVRTRVSGLPKCHPKYCPMPAPAFHTYVGQKCYIQWPLTHRKARFQIVL